VLTCGSPAARKFLGQIQWKASAMRQAESIRLACPAVFPPVTAG